MNDGSQPSQVIKTPDPDGEGVAPDYPCRVCGELVIMQTEKLHKGSEGNDTRLASNQML